jgi:altronate dehydratase large subunit
METILGYERADGSVGIRNHVVVIPSVSCANGVVGTIARAVPEVIPMYHACGCGRGGTDLELHSRVLQNVCKNPNIAAVLIVGLGCEMVNAEGMAMSPAFAGRPHARLMIQEEGGAQKTLEKGVKIVQNFLREAAALEPGRFPLERLIVGLECGGSDAFSGITANPAVGVASDWLVDAGATVIFTETTEMIGTAHILNRRAADTETAAKIEDIISEAEERTRRVLGPMAELAIAPGNMDGGMSTIREKSLGCIIKAGTRTIRQVVDYGESPGKRGLIVMDGPGYDTESMTGLAAAGAHLIIFTTGRGNPIGFPVAPVVKVASTSRMYRNMADDMDVNAGEILEGKSLEQKGKEIRDLILNVAGGEKTRAEINGQNGILCLYSRTPAL